VNIPWVNTILHTGALIQKKKVALATAHSWDSVWLVISLIVLEIWLAIISLPLYLVESTVTNEQGGGQYRVRRVITLSLLVVLGSIWLIKLLLGGFFIYYWNRLPQLQTQEATTQTTLSHDQLFAINQAATLPNEPLVTITTASETSSGTVIVTGKAIPKSTVLIYMTRSDSTNMSNQNDKVTIVTADANAKGLWEVRLSEYRFRFLKGTYTIQALWYNAADTMKSPLSQAKTFTITRQAPSPESLIHQADQWLNILLLVFIVGAITLTLILT